MRTLNQLLDSVTRETGQQGQQTKHSEAPTLEFLKAVLQELTRMGLLNSVSPELYQSWARNLADLDERSIKNGLKKARDFKGFFTLPAFRELCRFQPEDFGIPTCRDAYEIIYKTQFGKNGDLGHPVVLFAMRECGTYEMQSLSETECYRRFEYYFDAVAKRFMNGEKMEIPVVQAIPAKVERPRTEQELQELKKRNIEAMEQLKQLFK